MFDFTRKQALCAGLSVLFIGFVGQAESQTLSSQSVRPTAQAARLNTLPTIDGEVLGDSAWAAVAPSVDSPKPGRMKVSRQLSERKCLSATAKTLCTLL